MDGLFFVWWKVPPKRKSLANQSVIILLWLKSVWFPAFKHPGCCEHRLTDRSWEPPSKVSRHPALYYSFSLSPWPGCVMPFSVAPCWWGMITVSKPERRAHVTQLVILWLRRLSSVGQGSFPIPSHHSPINSDLSRAAMKYTRHSERGHWDLKSIHQFNKGKWKPEYDFLNITVIKKDF